MLAFGRYTEAQAFTPLNIDGLNETWRRSLFSQLLRPTPKHEKNNISRPQTETDLGMFGRTGAPQKGGPHRPEIVGRMHIAVSLLSIQITAAILRTVHMYLPNVFYINVRKFM